MRPLRITFLALSAALLLSAAPSAQADISCGFAPFPTFGNIHAFVGEPVVYDVTNTDGRYFDMIISWRDGDVVDTATFNPGDEHVFTHTYTTPGSYSPIAEVSVGSPEPPGVCKTSYSLGTVRVTRHGHH